MFSSTGAPRTLKSILVPVSPPNRARSVDGAGATILYVRYALRVLRGISVQAFTSHYPPKNSTGAIAPGAPVVSTPLHKVNSSNPIINHY